jgi:hypothetical protein
MSLECQWKPESNGRGDYTGRRHRKGQYPGLHMPKRCNEFQDLVTLIQEASVPRRAKVTPSALVPEPSSGTLREIDILVGTPVGPYGIKIPVEAKDEGRKMDATKMAAIIGK